MEWWRTVGRGRRMIFAARAVKPWRVMRVLLVLGIKPRRMMWRAVFSWSVEFERRVMWVHGIFTWFLELWGRV
jgi:hypothetical protein